MTKRLIDQGENFLPVTASNGFPRSMEKKLT
jgi:hypothetical protein